MPGASSLIDHRDLHRRPDRPCPAVLGDAAARRRANAAGINAKTLSTYMGHASITITFDRYGHLIPGNEDEARGLMDAYLDRSTGRRNHGRNHRPESRPFAALLRPPPEP
jgi:integrase